MAIWAGIDQGVQSFRKKEQVLKNLLYNDIVNNTVLYTYNFLRQQILSVCTKNKENGDFMRLIGLIVAIILKMYVYIKTSSCVS